MLYSLLLSFKALFYAVRRHKRSGRATWPVLSRAQLSYCNADDIFEAHTALLPAQGRTGMRAREKLKRSLARWYGVLMLCCAIVVSALVEQLPVLPY